MCRALVITLLLSSCAAPRIAGDGEHEPPSCGRVVLSALPPSRRRVDLILRVNGAVCRREPLYAGWRGRITRMCGPEWFAPGENRIELVVAPAGCAPAILRRNVSCRLPEPD
jgi:hypothetical protein